MAEAPLSKQRIDLAKGITSMFRVLRPIPLLGIASNNWIVSNMK